MTRTQDLDLSPFLLALRGFAQANMVVAPEEAGTAVKLCDTHLERSQERAQKVETRRRERRTRGRLVNAQ